MPGVKKSASSIQPHLSSNSSLPAQRHLPERKRSRAGAIGTRGTWQVGAKGTREVKRRSEATLAVLQTIKHSIIPASPTKAGRRSWQVGGLPPSLTVFRTIRQCRELRNPLPVSNPTSAQGRASAKCSLRPSARATHGRAKREAKPHPQYFISPARPPRPFTRASAK